MRRTDFRKHQVRELNRATVIAGQNGVTAVDPDAERVEAEPVVPQDVATVSPHEFPPACPGTAAPVIDTIAHSLTSRLLMLPDEYRNVLLTGNVVGVGAEIVAEYLSARVKHAHMRGPHEGWAVIYEEFVVELGAHVWAKNFDKAAARGEAIQVAAMALAFALEVCE